MPLRYQLSNTAMVGAVGRVALSRQTHALTLPETARTANRQTCPAPKPAFPVDAVPRSVTCSPRVRYSRMLPPSVISRLSPSMCPEVYAASYALSPKTQKPMRFGLPAVMVATPRISPPEKTCLPTAEALK